MGMKSFEEHLAQGRLTESAIVRWLRSKGHGVITVYEIEHHTGKGPRYLAPANTYVAPDILAFTKDGPVLWVEAKHKTVFSWHRITGRWVTGIDKRHYGEYLKVAEHSGLDVYIMFYHQSEIPDSRDLQNGCPFNCPVGLFGQRLEYLSRNINHTSDRWGSSGMVYWAHKTLIQMATPEEMSQVGAA